MDLFDGKDEINEDIFLYFLSVLYFIEMFVDYIKLIFDIVKVSVLS